MRVLTAASLVYGEGVRALTRNVARSLLTVLGVTIGIAAVVCVVAIGSAGSNRAQKLLHDLGDNLVWIEAGSRNVNGVRTGTKGTTSLTAEDADAIGREVSLVKSVSPQVDGNALVAYGNRSWTTHYRGVGVRFLEIKRYDVQEGAAFTDQDVDQASNFCLIGQTVRQQLFGVESPVGHDIRFDGHFICGVIGLLAPKGQSANGQDQDDTILMPYSTVQKKLKGKDSLAVDDVMCSAVSMDDVDRTIAQIVGLLRERHRILDGQDDDFNIRRPDEVIKAQIESGKTLAQLLLSIATISLLVGGIGIMNVMLVSVAERTREIGVRRAVGATAWGVQLQFLGEAVMLCMLGGVLGILLGVGASYVLGWALGWPVDIPLLSIVVAPLFAIGVGVVFGFYPAFRASRLDPIEALRRE